MPAIVRKLSRASAVVLLAASSLAIPAPTFAERAKEINSQTAAAKIQIDNFGVLNTHYYRGAQPQGRDYADLAALGVKTIINLTSDDADPGEQAAAAQAGIGYVQIPMSTRVAPTSAEIEEFLSVVNDPARQPVYVHCVGGRHRTGVMTAVYRMTADKWSGEKAFAEMKSYKYGADFLHPEFKSFVYSYRPPSIDAVAPAVVAAATR